MNQEMWKAMFRILEECKVSVLSFYGMAYVHALEVLTSGNTEVLLILGKDSEIATDWNHKWSWRKGDQFFIRKLEEFDPEFIVVHVPVTGRTNVYLNCPQDITSMMRFHIIGNVDYSE